MSESVVQEKWVVYTKGAQEIAFLGENDATFEGPDREANARLFTRAQHMDELIEAVKTLVADCEPSHRCRVTEKITTILAKIGGGE